MYSDRQFQISRSRTISRAATAALAIAILFALAAVAAVAQNTLPTTVREAAASQASAPRLTHPVAAQATRKSRPLVASRRAPAQDGDLYDNGPTNGTNDAYFIDIYQVSDSFVSNASTNMTSFDIALWTPAGATPLTADWSVGTSSFGSDIGSGSGAWTSVTLLCSNGGTINGGPCGGGFGYDVYDAKMNVGSLTVNAGQTYYLTLAGVTDNFGGRDAWDKNSGPSAAYHNVLGAVPSESFTIDGTTTCSYADDDSKTPAAQEQRFQDRTQVAQAQSFQVIYNFTGRQDGDSPAGLTMDQAGNFYGATTSGGQIANAGCGGDGCGTVYELLHQGASWVLHPLYAFKGAANGDGSRPSSRLIIGPDGSLYGATAYGGYTGNSDRWRPPGLGTVFMLKPPGGPPPGVQGGWTETVLHSFTGFIFDGKRTACSLQKPQNWVTQSSRHLPMDGGDGLFPIGDIAFDQAGNIYGATALGPNYPGECGCQYGPCGMVYALMPSNGGWEESIVFTFDYLFNGTLPSSGVVFDPSGVPYGTTTYSPGYQGGNGEIWFTTFGDVFANFGGSEGGPVGLMFDPMGNLFGVAGVCSGGTSVFEISGPFNFQNLHYFRGVAGDLVMDGAGNIYGTTGGDGLYSAGTVFELTPSNGAWTYTKLYDFTGGGGGNSPSGLILDGNGNLWGTTSSGGAYNHGVIFELTP